MVDSLHATKREPLTKTWPPNFGTEHICLDEHALIETDIFEKPEWKATHNALDECHEYNSREAAIESQ